MDSLRRASGALFYLLGTLAVTSIILVQRGILVDLSSTLLAVIDLPLLLTGMLFGGSTLVTSIGRGQHTRGLVIVVFVPLLLVFTCFAYLNFAMPFPE